MILNEYKVTECYKGTHTLVVVVMMVIGCTKMLGRDARIASDESIS